MGRARGYRTKARTHVEIEKVARRFREIIMDGDGASALPGVSLFEKLDRVTIRIGDEEIPVDYEIADLLPGAEARTRFDAKERKIFVALSAQTYRKLERGDYRARFTLLHELGHVLLHARTLMKLSAIPHAEAALMRVGHPVYEDSEWQADSFAAAALMPARAMRELEQKGRLDVMNIQIYFKVSLQAAEIRIAHYHSRKRSLIE